MIYKISKICKIRSEKNKWLSIIPYIVRNSYFMEDFIFNWWEISIFWCKSIRAYVRIRFKCESWSKEVFERWLTWIRKIQWKSFSSLIKNAIKFSSIVTLRGIWLEERWRFVRKWEGKKIWRIELLIGSSIDLFLKWIFLLWILFFFFKLNNDLLLFILLFFLYLCNIIISWYSRLNINAI